MYAPFFGLKQAPFSIAPDPRYLYMSERHREALAHLLYGVQGGGGFVLLTGEIGAGKTTVCRCFLEQIPRHCNVAYIFNPKLTVLELLQTVCHEFGIPVPVPAGGAASMKDHVDALNTFLLRTHSVGQNNVLIIDEAQNLSADVLEQLRLLTNLETNERKLLQIVLIGQPELRTMLARPELEQLGQRVIARYHLEALSERETGRYVAHRLSVAGLKGALPFDVPALRRIHQVTRGVPRRINLLCDRALLGAYATGKPRVDTLIVEKAAREVFGPRIAPPPARSLWRRWPLGFGVGAGVLAGAAAVAAVQWGSRPKGPSAASTGAPGASVVPAAAAALRRASGPALRASAASGAAAPPSAAASSFVAMSAASAGGHAVAPLRSIEDLEQRLESAPRDERTALRQLAPAWQLPATDDDPCVAASRQDVGCFRSHGGLPLLRELARPVVLGLRDSRDRPVYAVLAGLGPESATLALDGTRLDVPLALLTTSWRGDYATFWREPTGYTGSISEGARGPLVDMLAARLAQQQGASAPAPAQPFDATLKARVYTFQLAHGLTPDGVAGPTTLMQLNRTTGVDEPWLRVEPASIVGRP
ncbi:MAG TPA: AAA family ATPase [Burkholderiaceae bacterium]|nr:AAA family ATPase [Burkholderiaceae bacterium]